MGLNERIDKIAWQLFTERGYAQVKMDDIARELGMSKKTLYNTIPSKEALIHRLVEAFIAKVEIATAEIVNDPDLSCYEKLRGLPAYLLSQVSLIQPILFNDIRRFLPDTWALMDSTRRRLINERVGAVIHEGIEHGEIRHDLEAELVQDVLFNSLQGVITSALPLTDPVRFVKMIDTTMLLLYEGLAKRDSQ